jgi:hypothetical protein
MVCSEWIIPKYKEDKFNHLQNDSVLIFFYQGIENKEITNIKFLGLGLDRHMEWKTIVELMIPKMSSACYAVRSMYSFSDMTTLKIVYFVYFPCMMEYGITF